MRTPSNKVSSKIKQIEEEIKTLRESLKKPHLIKDSEGDYNIKSQIINKQNEMIELLIEQVNKSGH